MLNYIFTTIPERKYKIAGNQLTEDQRLFFSYLICLWRAVTLRCIAEAFTYCLFTAFLISIIINARITAPAVAVITLFTQIFSVMFSLSPNNR